MLLAWKQAKVLTYCGYITGFPADTPERIMRDIHTIQKELPVDLLEFFYLTPLPGSEDHQKLYKAGAWMDPDLNKYDLNHAVAEHQTMSKAEWEGAYWDAWKTYFSPEHVETILRRNAAMGMSVGKAMFLINWFIGSINIEKLHPLECGLIRRKYRRDRRPGLPIEGRLTFYPRHYLDMVTKQVRWVWLWVKLWGKYYEIKHNPTKLEYTDLALTPVFDEDEGREMFHTDEAEAYVAQQKKMRATIDAAA
jgi:hypothetical protein